jgi:PHD/YefM family antitoxin component YafN of YafNO toxin-antitoxin module
MDIEKNQKTCILQKMHSGFGLMPISVAATEFARKFRQYQREVLREPIKVVNHGDVTGYFISPEDYERFQQVLAASRRRYDPGELPEHLKAAVREAKMGREHESLNLLMDDE